VRSEADAGRHRPSPYCAALVTLILGLIHRHGVVQVSDRLTTYPDGAAFDRTVNKTIVASFSDAVAVLSYTGSAFLDRVPTDVWLASKLSNETVDELMKGKGLRTGGQLRRLDLGRSLRTLAAALNATWPQQPSAVRNAGLEIGVCAVQMFKRRRWRSSSADILRDAATKQFVVSHGPKQFGPGYYVTANPMVNGRLVTRSETKETLRAAQGDAPRALATLIQFAADRCQPSLIGRDCVSVAINLWQRVVEVRYFGSTVDRVGLSWTNADGTDRSQVSPAAYTPWIIGPNVIAWPSLQVNGGGMTTFFGQVQVKLLGPADGPDGTSLAPSPSGILYASLSYDRVPLPPDLFPGATALRRHPIGGQDDDVTS
jgi:hypothetical protein